MMNTLCFVVLFLTLGPTHQFAMGFGSVQIDISPNKFVSVNEDEVHISCFLNGTEDNDRAISAIQIIKNTATPIVLLRDCSNMTYETDDSKNIKAEGYIDVKVVTNSYLNMTISYPESKDTGVYTCVVFYYDDGIMKEEKATASLLVDRPFVENLESVLSNVRSAYRELKDNANYKSAFSVTQNNGHFTMTPKKVLILPDIITKIGDDYNETTGIFSPQRAGLYAFHLAIRTQKHVYIELRVNGVVITRLSSTYSGAWNPTAMSYVQELHPGDKLKAVVMSATSLFHCCRQVVFSGYLVSLL